MNDGQGHRGTKFAKMADFKVYLLHWYACNQKELMVNFDTRRQYLNFILTCLIF